MSNIVRSSKGLANALFDELDALTKGDSTPQMARSKAAIANTICAVTRLEMDYARFVNQERGTEENALKALPMGL